MTYRVARLAGAAVLAAVLQSFSHSAVAEVPKVVVSIKPLHGLASAVMDGVGTPELIVQGAASPHGYRMKPSQAAALSEADVVFWVGPALESFLERPLGNLSQDATVVEAIETAGLTLYEFREGGVFEEDDHHDDHADHDEHDEEHHDDHADHDEHDEEPHDDHADHDEPHDDHADHDEHDDQHQDDHADHDEHDEDVAGGHGHDHHHHEGGTDPHIWLDPANAVVVVGRMAEVLAHYDPANAEKYRANAAALVSRLDSLDAELAATLNPLGDRAYLSFHDAYRYFEERYGLQPLGTISINPEVAPGAERIQEIQEALREMNAVCVFTEPQFPAKLVTLVSEGADTRVGVLDPLGADVPEGPDHYIETLKAMGAAFQACLNLNG